MRRGAYAVSRGPRQNILVRLFNVGRRRGCMSMTLPVQIRRGLGQGALVRFADPRTGCDPCDSRDGNVGCRGRDMLAHDGVLYARALAAVRTR